VVTESTSVSVPLVESTTTSVLPKSTSSSSEHPSISISRSKLTTSLSTTSSSPLTTLCPAIEPLIHSYQQLRQAQSRFDEAKDDIARMKSKAELRSKKDVLKHLSNTRNQLLASFRHFLKCLITFSNQDQSIVVRSNLSTALESSLLHCSSDDNDNKKRSKKRKRNQYETTEMDTTSSHSDLPSNTPPTAHIYSSIQDTVSLCNKASMELSLILSSVRDCIEWMPRLEQLMNKPVTLHVKGTTVLKVASVREQMRSRRNLKKEQNLLDRELDSLRDRKNDLEDSLGFDDDPMDDTATDELADLEQQIEQLKSQIRKLDIQYQSIVVDLIAFASLFYPEILHHISHPALPLADSGVFDMTRRLGDYKIANWNSEANHHIAFGSIAINGVDKAVVLKKFTLIDAGSQKLFMQQVKLMLRAMKQPHIVPITTIFFEPGTGGITDAYVEMPHYTLGTLRDWHTPITCNRQQWQIATYSFCISSNSSRIEHVTFHWHCPLRRQTR